MPKVSICIPTYNQTEYLERTLSSILTQSYADYEVVIADDSTSSVVENFVNTFDFKGKLRYFHNKTPLGSPKNWNYCISKAQGDYIKIMHHDDWFSTNTSLEKLVSLLEAADNSMAFCACNNIAVDGSILYYHSITDSQASTIKLYPEFLLSGNSIGAPSVTIFKKTNLVFDEKIKYLVDIDFYIRYLKISNKFSYTTEALVNIGHDDGRVTDATANNKELLIFEYSYTYQKLNYNRKNLKWCFKAFWNLFNHLNIVSVHELNKAGWYGEIPHFIHHIINARKLAGKTKTSKLKMAIEYLAYRYIKQFERY